MTAGEINYDEMFHLSFSEQGNGERELAFLPIAYIMLIPFMIIMPILFLNMLVSSNLIFLLHAQNHAAYINTELVLCQLGIISLAD